MRRLLLPGPLTGTPWYEGLGTRLDLPQLCHCTQSRVTQSSLHLQPHSCQVLYCRYVVWRMSYVCAAHTWTSMVSCQCPPSPGREPFSPMHLKLLLTYVCHMFTPVTPVNTSLPPLRSSSSRVGLHRQWPETPPTFNWC